MQTYYHTLGVASDTSQRQIRQAYLQLCKQYHPDKNKGADWAQERLKVINEAYETLSDPMRRLAYDKQIRVQKAEQSAEIQATRSKVNLQPTRVDLTDLVNTSSYLFRPMLMIALAFVFFICALLIFETEEVTPSKAKTSYSEQAYESERTRFFNFCKQHPRVLSKQEFDKLIEQPIEPGFTYLLNRLLVQGDTADIHYLIQMDY